MSDPRIDQYIERAQPFAQPVLAKLRQLIHTACPEVQETIKWGMPAFEFKGPICGFASFKQHCTFGFWKSALIEDPKGYLKERSAQGGEAMGNMGRMVSIKDLPPDRVLVGFIRQAMKLNEAGIKVEKKPAKQKKLEMHPAFTTALNRNKIAKTFFNSLAPGQQREYADWVNDAKSDATRTKRIATSIEWLGEHKRRLWKYEKQ